MNRIRSLREEADMTQKELAARLGVKGGAVVSKYENGVNPLPEDTLRLLSIIFGVSVDYILGLSDDRKKGTSLASPQLSWDALSLVEGADALSEEERRMIFSCVKAPELLAVVGKYMALSSRSQRKAVAYMDMLKIVECSNAEGRQGP